MRVSAIRFGDDLWQVLEQEAARVGVSVAQYVREASLARVAAAAAARGEDVFELLARAGESPREVSPEAEARAGDGKRTRTGARAARAKADETLAAALALKAQSELAIRRAHQLGHELDVLPPATAPGRGHRDPDR
jgi:hypothetical protein